MEDRRRDDEVEEVMNISDDDAAFVLGRGGATKRKIARACGAKLELDEKELTIAMYGTKEEVWDTHCVWRFAAAAVCERERETD